MILVGLLLILLAAGLGTLLFIAAQPLSDKIDLEAFGTTVGLTPLNLAIAGALAMLLLWFGWAILRSSMKRKARHRREAREAERQADEEREQREREALEQLHSQRLATDAARDRAQVAENRLNETQEVSTEQAHQPRI